MFSEELILIDLLFKKFIKNYESIRNPEVRKDYGIFSSIIGIILNLILFVVKYTIGTLSASVSVTADSFNNLSDTGSYAVTLFGFKMANKKADPEHPFGHGRIEYVSGLIVAFIIFTVGFEFAKSSVLKIITPKETLFTLPMLLVLIITIPVKLFLSHLNFKIGKKINSTAICAAGKDSLNDVLVTAVTIISAVISIFTTIPIDGYIGLLVALYVIYSGFTIAMDTLNPLLGQSPDKEIVKEIEKRLLSYDEIRGIHDLIVHSYGAENYIASVHAEVSADGNILKIHDIIDLAEREIAKDMGIMITIHMDPVETNNETVNKLKEIMENILRGIDEKLTMHDFRVVIGDTHTNMIFDIVLSDDNKLSEEEIREKIERQLEKLPHKYFAVIVFDWKFY